MSNNKRNLFEKKNNNFLVKNALFKPVKIKPRLALKYKGFSILFIMNKLNLVLNC